MTQPEKLPLTTNKKSNDKIKCANHKKEKVQFLCVQESIKICALCVPQHNGHELLNLKE